MPFKFDADGHIVVDEKTKNPIFIHPDGRETAFDADTTIAAIGRLNNEAKTRREEAEAWAAKYKPFEGIEDAEGARKALETIKNIDEGKLLTAGKVQEIKDAAARSAQEAVAAATRQAQAERDALVQTNTKLTNDLNTHIVGGAFANSPFIKEKLAIPADIAQKFFGDRFKVDGGKLVPLDSAGNPIWSATRHGETADFEEAFPSIVASYPHKDMILKGSGATGSGANGSVQNTGGKKAYSRSQFDAMDPATQRATGMDVAAGKATISDN